MDYPNQRQALLQSTYQSKSVIHALEQQVRQLEGKLHGANECISLQKKSQVFLIEQRAFAMNLALQKQPVGLGRSKACQVLGINRSTLYRRTRPDGGGVKMAHFWMQLYKRVLLVFFLVFCKVIFNFPQADDASRPTL